MTIGVLELQILRELAKVTPPRRHDGGDFVRSLESLRGAGYIDQRGDLTPSGREALLREEEAT